MLSLDGLKILINRGDTGSLTVTFTGDDTPEDGTIALVGLKKTKDSVEPIWEKSLTILNSKVTIPLFTVDTDYPYGKYYWGLRLLYQNGDIYTPMEEPQEFRIMPVIPITNGGGASG